jgi:tripartite-type tricarboxylate transporter receptor subunit TctC
MGKDFSRSRRRLGLALAGAPFVAGVAPAWGQAGAYPDRPVRIVIPSVAGSTNDLVLRILAERLSQRWGQPVVVDNRPGGATLIGSDFVAKSPPDGYTLLANVTSIVQNPALRRRMPYDTLRDFAPVAQINRQHLAVIVRPGLPVNSVTELIAYARANPGKVSFGSWGIASTAHMICEKIQIDGGVSMVHVPYKGAQDIVRALMNGEADAGGSDMLTPLPHIRAGRVRIIGVNGPARAPLYPNVQTLAEAGVTGFEAYGWFGLFAPAGTPAAVVRKISQDLNAVQADPELARRFIDEMQVYPSNTTPEEFTAIFERDLGIWAAVIKRAGISLD